MSDDKRYKMLMIEDDQVDRMAFERFARENDSLCVATFAGSVAEARARLAGGKFDVVITDYHLGDGTAFDVIPLVKDAPVIFATGSGNEEVAAQALKAGAYDYLVKDEDRNYLKLLMLTVVRSMGRRRAERQARMLSEAVRGISDAVCVSNDEGWIVFANDAFCLAYGYAPQEALREKYAAVAVGGPEPDAGAWRGETTHRRKDGTTFPAEYARNLLVEEGGRTSTVHISRDVSERRRGEAEKDVLIGELQEALSQVKKLSGLLPTCSGCKKVRDEGGAWTQIETYISQRSEAAFSHGVCPECMRSLYPEFADDVEKMAAK